MYLDLATSGLGLRNVSVKFCWGTLSPGWLWKSLTSVSNGRVLRDDVVTIIVIKLLMTSVVLMQRQQTAPHKANGSLTSLIDGTWTSLALIGGFGGGT